MKKIITSLALLLIMLMPIFAVGCKESITPFITIHTDFQNEYFFNEAINLENGKIEYTNASGDKTTIDISNSEVVITNFSTAEEGTRNMLITYQGCEVEYEYTVSILHDVVKSKSAFYYNKGQNSLFARLYNEKNGYQPNNHNYANYQTCYDIITFMDNNYFLLDFAENSDTLFPSYDYNKGFTATRSIENRKVVYTVAKDEYTSFTITVISANEVRLQGKIQSYADLDYTFELYGA